MASTVFIGTVICICADDSFIANRTEFICQHNTKRISEFLDGDCALEHTHTLYFSLAPVSLSVTSP